ncbi:MAG: GTP cyclohydrolase II [Gammaproteobacteria bacterium]
MFSYVDRSIRARLEEEGLLVTLDRDGHIVPGDGSGAFMSVLGPVPIPRFIGDEEIMLEWYPFVRRTELSAVLAAARDVDDGNSEAFRNLLHSSMSVNSVFALPGFRSARDPLVRIHSCCLTGDVFGSRRCDCGPQLEAAFEQIKAAGAGAVVYMSGHEGRGIGLWAKAVTYLLQDRRHNTYQANVALGLPEDSRDFSDAAVVLKYLLDGRPIRLLSNNPDKRAQLEAHGQPVAEAVSLIAGICEHNRRYLQAKRSKGHRVPENL